MMSIKFDFKLRQLQLITEHVHNINLNVENNENLHTYKDFKLASLMKRSLGIWDILFLFSFKVSSFVRL
jgi:hypothetical protein